MKPTASQTGPHGPTAGEEPEVLEEIEVEDLAVDGICGVY
ncbi:MAG: variant-type mycofactocin precursor [Thermoleophilia bacterium]|nr:variant-type mycofactocin precursor [Thermoleophilia bacterium]